MNDGRGGFVVNRWSWSRGVERMNGSLGRDGSLMIWHGRGTGMIVHDGIVQDKGKGEGARG
jgi:hypothetical protein